MVAYKGRECYLKFQPIAPVDTLMNCDTGQISGAEALVRCRDSTTGEEVYPNDFLPEIRERGYMGELTRWAIRLTADHLKETGGSIPLSVNIDTPQLNVLTLVCLLWCVPVRLRGGFTVEITESHKLTLCQKLVIICISLANFHCAIDDCLTGKSTMVRVVWFLKYLPGELTIKFDRGHINRKHFQGEPGEWISLQPLVGAFCGCLESRSRRSGGVSFVFEGVEDIGQLFKAERAHELAKKYGITCYCQGYILGQAMPFSSLVELKEAFDLRRQVLN